MQNIKFNEDQKIEFINHIVILNEFLSGQIDEDEFRMHLQDFSESAKDITKQFD